MMNAISVPATFTVLSGRISIVGGQVTNVEVTIDASSYKSTIAKRNRDVTSRAFFDADNYPTMTFTASGGSNDEVSGEVTVKGRPAPATFAITQLLVDGSQGSFVAKTTVDRFAFGVDKSPAFVIGKEIDVTVTASATATT